MRGQINSQPRNQDRATRSLVSGEQPRRSASALIAHVDAINTIAVLANGQRAVSGSNDNTLRLWDLETKAELQRFSGHTGGVLSVAVLPDQRRALTGSGDRTMRVWDLENGAEIQRLVGHLAPVMSVAVDPTGRLALSGSADRTVKLWDLETSAMLREFKGHTGPVTAVAAFPDGRRGLSGSLDRTVRVWDLKTGNELIRLQGHTDAVEAVAIIPDGQRALSVSWDRTLRVWDVATGAELRCIQGHSTSLHAVAIFSDGERAISGSRDGTLCLWDLKTGDELRRFEGHTNCVSTVAILPTGRRALSGSVDTTLRLWDIETIDGEGVDSENVAYTTARIALLGDSGVGKTGLGFRIAHGAFRAQDSTHGQQFWLISQLRGSRSDGTQCEAVLWDLAGQPDYRLVHALFLDKVDVGLLVFDATSRERPLAGVEYWLRHLRSATRRSLDTSATLASDSHRSWAPTLLVAARSDRGTPALSATEIKEFCKRQGIAECIITSAKNNTGVADLIERVKATIPWDHLTATTTTRTFKRIKEHVLELKETFGGENPVLQPDELRRQLKDSDPEWNFTDDEMMTAVGHLVTHGYVTRFQRTNGDEVILLAPDLLVNLASSIVLEGRRHERGLGLLDEARLLAGDYPLPELTGSDADVRTALLDAVVRLFLQRNLCFRETINDRTCLVFPSLINEKRPPTNDPDAVDDVSYRVSGAVETVYAALVVQLGYTNLFRRDHHWQNQAQYELEPGEICGFRQTVEQEGEIELVLTYSKGAGDDTRKLFEGTFERFLKRRQVQIGRLPTVRCEQGHLQERGAVLRAIDNGRESLYCDACGEKLATPLIDSIGMPTEKDSDFILAAELRADRRTTYEVAVAWLKGFRRDHGKARRKPSCFISYAWAASQYERWVEQLADHLQNADVDVILDRWHNLPGASIGRFIERIDASDFVCAIGTPGYRRKDLTKKKDPVVQAELRLIKSKLMKRDTIHDTVIPVLYEGTPEDAFPPLFKDSVFLDFRTETRFFVHLFELVLTIHRIPFDDKAARQYRNNLLSELPHDAAVGSARKRVPVSFAAE